MNKKIKITLAVFSTFTLFLFSNRIVLAAFNINIPIPGLGEPTLPNYVKAFYRFGIGVLALLSMGMIVLGGFQYMISAGESITKTGKARAKIKNAIIGLIVALVSFLILNTINPDILKAPTELEKTGGVTNNGSTGKGKEGQLCSPDGKTYPECDEGLVCKELASLYLCQKDGTTPSPAVCPNVSSNNLCFESQSIANQYSTASSDLKTFLNCMAINLPKDAGIISSISDDHIIDGTCTIWSTGICNTPECQHSCNSCHYGGSACPKESYAVDYRDIQNEAILRPTAKACGASGWNPEPEENHIHVSLGESYKCGCDVGMTDP